MTVDDLGEDVGEIGVRFDGVQLAGFDQRRDDRPVLGPAVGSGEQSVLPIKGDRPDGPFDGVGVDLDAAIVEEQAQPLPVRERVADLRDDPGLLFLRPAAPMAGPGEDLDPSDRPISYGIVRWHHHGTKRLAIIVAQLPSTRLPWLGGLGTSLTL